MDGNSDERLQIVRKIRAFLPLEGDKDMVESLQADIDGSATYSGLLRFNNAFKQPLDAPHVTTQGLLTVLETMFQMNGALGIHQFFSGTPQNTETARAVVSAFAQLDRGTLAHRFHLSEVVAGLESNFNYEAIACFLLACVSVEPDLFYLGADASTQPRAKPSANGEPSAAAASADAANPSANGSASGAAAPKAHAGLELAVVCVDFLARYAHDRQVDKLGDAFGKIHTGMTVFAGAFERLPARAVAQAVESLSGAAFSYALIEPLIAGPHIVRLLLAVPFKTAAKLLGGWVAEHAAEVLDLVARCDLAAARAAARSAAGTAGAAGADVAQWSEFVAANFWENGAFSALLEYAKAGKVRSLRLAGAVAQLLQSSDTPEVQALQVQLVQQHPRLINFGQGYDDAILASEAARQLVRDAREPAANEDGEAKPDETKDDAKEEDHAFERPVEDEMKLIFQKMYEQQYDIHEVIALLERLKHSDVPRDQDLFACMVHSLFDEYQFFPQYPVKALATTAVLFGSLVHFRLVEGVALAVALRLVLDALRMDAESNMFRFGLQALVELRQRLSEFPKYCKALLGVPALRHQQQFYAQIRAVAEVGDAPADLFKSLNFTLVDEPEDEEPDVKDAMKRLALLVNNLTAKTLADKSGDILRETERVGALRFAKLLVARAIKEANYHEIYAALVDALPAEILQFCINVIVMQLAFILNSGDALSTEKRLSLKNLGQFLGMLTLARDRPVLFTQVHVRLLLAEGVRYERLPAVLPLVAKLMVQTAQSRVFVPSSPFVQAVLRVLSELYHFGALKLTMKFEIEVLGKALGVDIPALEAATYIRDERLQVDDLNAVVASLAGPALANGLLVSADVPSLAARELSTAGLAQTTQQGGLAGVAGLAGVVPGAPGAPGMPGVQVPGVATAGNLPGMSGAPGGIPSVNAVGSAAVGESVGMGGYLPSAPLGVPLVGTTEFVTHPGLRQLLEIARSKTLVDVLLPVIERSVSIASFTAKELVLKDLAYEPDEGVLQAAAHSQALVLAASMALVTAKEPFVETLTQNLRALLVSQGHGDSPALLEQTQIAARETMDSLVALIESVAREKVVAEVDEALIPAYEARAAARARNEPFRPVPEPELPTELPKLPDLLAVRPAGLLPEQMAVYDNFAAQAARVFQESEEDSELVYREIQGEFAGLLDELVAATRASARRLGDLSKNDRVLSVLSSLVEYAQGAVADTEPLALRFSHLVVQALFGAESTASVLCRECLCYVLGDLCRVSSVTAKEVVLWLLYADDPKKYNAKVIGTLLRSRLVTPTEIDAMLTKDLADLGAKPRVLEYAVRLLLDALVGPEPYCLRSDFAGTVLAISRLDPVAYPPAGVLVTSLLETRGQGAGNETHVFAEWTRLMQHHATATSPMLLHAFVRDLHSLGWCAAPDQLCALLRAALTVSVQSYTQSRSFVGVDAVALLLTTVLDTSDASEDVARLLLSIVTLSAATELEKSEKEGAEPETDNSVALVYYRLFSSIATSLPRKFVGVLAESILFLQPLAFPSFAAQWMTLVSHRFVLGRLLDSDNTFEPLFSLLKTMVVFLRYCWLSPVVPADAKNFVYRGTERICLVILHDAPEFFVRYADEITGLLVFEFVQLRNLVLCAFPASVSLPHPVEMRDVEYIEPGAGILASVEAAQALLTERKIARLVENACLAKPQLTPQIVIAIQTALAYAKPVPDCGVDFSTVSVSMVGYNALCTFAAHMYTVHNARTRVEESGAAQFCGRMLLTLSRENRYAFISAITNHLRYPEKHTYFFSHFLLQLFRPFGERMFKDGVTEVRHIVTRVLLERLMAHRAHPWGLMATFAELLRGEYNFWDMPFIKESSELSELFSTLYAHISAQ